MVMGRGHNDGASLLYGEIIRAPSHGDEMPMQRAAKILFHTCGDPSEGLDINLADAVADLHHWADANGVPWGAALNASDDIHWRKRERGDDLDGLSEEAHRKIVCRSTYHSENPGWDEGHQEEELRIIRADRALDGISMEGDVSRDPARRKVEAGLACLQIASERFGIDWETILRRAETYHRADAEDF